MSKGRIHSFQSFSTVDGPGIRSVVFMQGCTLRCLYCHNPDTWDFGGGKEIMVEDLYAQIERCIPYYKSTGGVTVSGGEAINQAEFVKDLFIRCREHKIHTTLDTSGCLLDEEVKALLALTDLVLLDIKMNEESLYQKWTQGSLKKTLEFLAYCNHAKIQVWIRQVIIEGVNDDEASIHKLAELLKPYEVIKKVDFLPFSNLCIEKYKTLNLRFPLLNTPNTKIETISKVEKIYKQVQEELG